MSVQACPECNAYVHPSKNRRAYCDGGRKAASSERWLCRECDATFPDPTERPSKRSAERL